MNTNYGIEGTDQQDFKNIHVYIGGESMGTYEIPCNIPILKSGEQTIEIFPGITENGIAETGTSYPFIKKYSTTINLIPDSIIEIIPVYEYYDECVFWHEDFEDPAIKFETDPSVGSGWNLTNNPNEVFEKNYSAKVTLDDNNDRFRVVSEDLTNLPGGGAEVFMEVHYKNENSVLMGLIAGNGGGENTYPMVILNSQGDSPEWKKMYINLKNYISDEPNATYFNVFFDGILDTAGTSADILIDNIKIVHTE